MTRCEAAVTYEQEPGAGGALWFPCRLAKDHKGPHSGCTFFFDGNAEVWVTAEWDGEED